MDIESLARETDTPVATVQEIYKAEHAKLDREARIKIFVPVLIHRRVKELLQITTLAQSFAPFSDLTSIPPRPAEHSAPNQ